MPRRRSCRRHRAPVLLPQPGDDGGARPSLPTWSPVSHRPLHQATRARAPLAMPGLAAAEQDAVSLVRRVARALNRRISDLVALLFRHKRARPPASPPPSARPSNPNPCCLTWQSAGIRTSLPPRSLSKSSSSRTRNYSLHVSKDQDSVCYSTVTIIVVTSALALLLQCGGAVRRPLQYQPGSRRT